MSEVAAIDQSKEVARIVEILTRLGKFVASDEFKALSKRLREINAKTLHRGEAPAQPQRRFEDFGNFAFTSAIHGIFIGIWSEFELGIEVLIMNFSGMTKETTSIVCTPIQAGIKMNILLSLINKDKEDEIGTKLLKKVQTAASRNIFVHGLWDVEDADSISIYYREAYNRYVVCKKPKNWRDVSTHIMGFMESVANVYRHFGITQEDITEYKKSIVDLEPIHASRAEQNRQSKTNSRKPKK